MKILNLKEFKKETGVYITQYHTGKMEGMYSLSTSKLLNPLCKQRMKNKETICSKCYVSRIFGRFPRVSKTLAQNTKVLTNKVLKEFPYINKRIFRLEAFGDLINTTQVINYFNLCKANKPVIFALWTKNPHLIEETIKLGYRKPKNLVVIVSSVFVNKRANLKDYKYKFIDQVFTVYTKDYAKENKININCGAKSCVMCRKCYEGSIKYINELVK